MGPPAYTQEKQGHYATTSHNCCLRLDFGLIGLTSPYPLSPPNLSPNFSCSSELPFPQHTEPPYETPQVPITPLSSLLEKFLRVMPGFKGALAVSQFSLLGGRGH